MARSFATYFGKLDTNQPIIYFFWKKGLATDFAVTNKAFPNIPVISFNTDFG